MANPRLVLESDQGELILLNTQERQKYHLIHRAQQSCFHPKEVVMATEYRDKEKCKIYKCEPIPENRMTVEVWQVTGYSSFANYRIGEHKESTKYFRAKELKNYIECHTSHKAHKRSPRLYSEGKYMLILIKEGSERDVLEIFVRSALRHFLLEEIGILYFHIEGSTKLGDLQHLDSPTDFEQAWEKNNGSLKNLIEEFGLTQKDWETLLPRLAEWTRFTTKTVKPKTEVNHYNCVDHLLRSHLWFDNFKRISDIKKGNVMKSLAALPSVS